VAVGIANASRGECLKAFVVLKAGATLTKAEVLAWCRDKLAAYKVPRHVEFREELPKTIVGKVLRRILRAEEDELHTQNNIVHFASRNVPHPGQEGKKAPQSNNGEDHVEEKAPELAPAPVQEGKDSDLTLTSPQAYTLKNGKN
jgi:long-chain acyl-CoA synthetase